MSAFEDFVRRHGQWSQRVFGAGRQTGGLTDHIEKEVAEIRAKPDDLVEWLDVMILAMDGYLRHGGTPEALLRDLERKLGENMARRWPDPGNGDSAVEHERG